MSTSLSDSETGLYSRQMFTLFAVGLFVVFYLSAMKMCFGTYFLRTAASNYSKNKVVQKRYYEMFATRDNLMYHISWAKTRGEPDEARSLMKQLEKIDQEIDRIEMDNPQLFGKRTQKPLGEKQA